MSSNNDWVSLSEKEINDFLNGGSKKESYKMVPHTFTLLKGVGKQYCTRCGLFAMNNKLSEWAIDKGCMHKDHPQWESKVRKLTKRSWQQ